MPGGACRHTWTTTRSIGVMTVRVEVRSKANASRPLSTRTCSLSTTAVPLYAVNVAELYRGSRHAVDGSVGSGRSVSDPVTRTTVTGSGPRAIHVNVPAVL